MSTPTLASHLQRPSFKQLLFGLVVACCAVFAMSYATASGLGKVLVQSNPSGAEVVMGAQVVGTTPATLSLPEGSSVELVVKKAGYKPQSVYIVPKAGKVTTVNVALTK